MKFFTSDTHFFDAHLLRGTAFAPARGDFVLIEQMHATMIQNWNAVVTPNDTVYHLGDIAVLFGKTSHEQIYNVLKQLNGQIVFVKGNHDTRDLFKYLARQDATKFSFEDVGVYFKLAHRQFYLTHYPLMLGVTPNAVNLHGHIHHASVSAKESLNVGVDSSDLAYLPARPFGQPLSEAEIFALLDAKAADFMQRR